LGQGRTNLEIRVDQINMVYMNYMTQPVIEFQPPINSYSIVGFGEHPDGTRTSATVLVLDTNHHFFTLHVEREDINVISSSNTEIAESPEDNESTVEPVFYLPAKVIDETEIEFMFNQIGPDLLRRYLVLQTDESIEAQH
jgi:hypothetical protein